MNADQILKLLWLTQHLFFCDFLLIVQDVTTRSQLPICILLPHLLLLSD